MMIKYRIQALKTCGSTNYSVWKDGSICYSTKSVLFLTDFLQREVQRLDELGIKLKLLNASLVPGLEEEVFSYTY